MNVTQAEMERRFVHYAHLKGCTTAFIDTRSPGSDRKENFTIIGPGVAENPEQYVHIGIPHGFNIGGARQPPHCINSQHSHTTAEVFVVHTGQWRFKMGEQGDDSYIDLQPGDTISIPTKTFRGFENIGVTPGFIFSVLGSDNPGRVTWAPYVFEAARQHGLVLLENGRLIDTQFEAVPQGATLMPPTTSEEAALLKRYSTEEIAQCVVRVEELAASGGLSCIAGFAECPIIGRDNASEAMRAGKISWSHGFNLRALRVQPGARTMLHRREEEEVLFMQKGTLRIEWRGGSLDLGPGDTLTVPKRLDRAYSNPGDVAAGLYIVRGTDRPAAATWAAN